MDLKYTTLYDLLMSELYTPEKIKNAYLKLLNMLTCAPDMSHLDFSKKVNEINTCGDIIIAYCFDIETQEVMIVGSGTLFYEPKIIHGGSYVGHIEDVVVHENYRKKGISSSIIQRMIEHGKKKCYKIILDCKPEIEDFYEKNGFVKRGTQMAMYF